MYRNESEDGAPRAVTVLAVAGREKLGAYRPAGARLAALLRRQTRPRT